MTTNRSDLFAGQDWTVIYRAFSSINFNASDPPSINRALRAYIQAAYPEDFNDYIASSEFIAILDLLSWLAGTLAYKTDIAARENFLETAESRESILRLARFLSYNATRSRPARGILKIVGAETTEDVRDAFGQSLANTPVVWNDPDDADWFERFIALMNAAMLPTNPFGTPLRQGEVSGSDAALYRLNGGVEDADLTFSAQVAGTRMTFEVVNGDFDENGALFQRLPDPFAAMHLYYLNDGGGNDAPRTGFFAFFKQGSTERRTFQINTPVENQLLQLDTDNITQDDLWVQTVDEAGRVLVNWARVPAIFSENITFNSLPLAQRDIYAAVTGDDDRVTLRFSDGRFGNAPVGIIRATYRVGNGLSYTVRAGEIDRIRLTFPYVDRNGTPQRLTLTFSLVETVSNAAARETEEEIRLRAPLVYASQGRMVSGEDYNTFPLATNVAIRIKALNRVYSGQSRHIERHDPTGTYSDVSVFGEDGILFREPYGIYAEVPTLLNRTPEQMVELHMLPILRAPEVALQVRTQLFESVPVISRVPQGRTWRVTTVYESSATGWFAGGNDARLRTGASLRFRPVGAPQDGSRDVWTAIVDISNPDFVGTAPLPGEIGAVTLSESIPNNAALVDLIPRYAPELQPSLLAGDFGLLTTLDTNNSGSLWYDWTRDTGDMWRLSLNDSRPVGTSSFAVRVLPFSYIPLGEGGGVWQLSAEGLRYVFESERRCEFYVGGRRAIDSRTGEQRADTIRVLKVNEDLHTEQQTAPRRYRSFDRDWSLILRDLYRYPNGSAEPRRCIVQLADDDEDGVPDRPDTFDLIVSPATWAPSLEGGQRLTRGTAATEANRLLFWRRVEDRVEVPLPKIPDLRDTAWRRMVIAPSLPALVAGVTSGRPRVIGYVPAGTDGTTGTFYAWSGLSDASGEWLPTSGYVVRLGRGANVANEHLGLTADQQPDALAIAYNWRHYATMESRIDPAATNIHDIFVLSTAYDAEVRDWISRGADPASQPTPPSELDLRLAFRELEQFRMFSDQIIWRPVQYKALFGPGAAPELRAQFKVVRLPGSALTDGEIRSRVVRAVNEYFAAARWDFGETFYYTELAAYLHQQLAGIIGSVVLVPTSNNGVFGDGFEVTARADEMFISTAQISDVILIGSNTPTAIRSVRR